MIEVDNLTRVFRTYKKQPGFWGGVKGLLRREFEEVVAADHVSFNISEGELVGFLGPNGAGKTTTLKMLSGLIYPTSGSARVGGFDPSKRRNEYRRIFALVLGQKNQLWWDLPAIESFNLLRHIYGVPKPQFTDTLDSLVVMLGVESKLRTMVRELSLGERMKMELIAALLHRPRVLFLDEPTIGLDVLSQRAVRNFLREYNRTHKVTIPLTSHYMADIKELCERVIVIHKGKKIHDGSIDRLDATGSRTKIVRIVPSPQGWPESWRPSCGTYERMPDGTIVIHVPSERVVAVFREALDAGAVADITIQEVPLEDIISDVFTRAG